MPGTDALSLVFSALADPTRRAILVRLSEGEATVNELAEPFDISLPAISRHLKVLAEAGLIERSKQAQWRTNTLKADGLTGATGFIEELTRVWGERFDRLDAHLDFLKRQLAQNGPSAPPPALPNHAPPALRNVPPPTLRNVPPPTLRNVPLPALPSQPSPVAAPGDGPTAPEPTDLPDGRAPSPGGQAPSPDPGDLPSPANPSGSAPRPQRGGDAPSGEESA